MIKFRLVHVGVAVAVAAAAVTGVGLVQLAGAAGTGSASSLVSIVPCRLVDTRAAEPVGGRATPLGSGETATFMVRGTNGNCIIPATATGVSLNVTVANPTASSFLTVYPGDAPSMPTVSNLNWTATSSPTPNQVTVGLSAGGALMVYNLTGNVDVVIDVMGYYEPAGAGAAGPQGPAGVPGPVGPAGPAGAAGSGGSLPALQLASSPANTTLNSGGSNFYAQTVATLQLEAGNYLLEFSANVGAQDVSAFRDLFTCTIDVQVLAPVPGSPSSLTFANALLHGPGTAEQVVSNQAALSVAPGTTVEAALKCFHAVPLPVSGTYYVNKFATLSALPVA